MATKIQLRRDTGDNWDSEDPVLAEGEIGINLDTNQFKIGDGSTDWSNLPYNGSNGGGGGLPLVRATIEFTDDDVSLNDSVWEGSSSSDIAVISNVNHSSPGIYRGNGTSTPDRATEFDDAAGFILISDMQMDNPSNQNPEGAKVIYFIPPGFEWDSSVQAFEVTTQISNVVAIGQKVAYPEPPQSGTYVFTSTDGVLSWEAV